MEIGDVKRLLGKAVIVDNPYIKGEFILTAYVLRVSDKGLLHQLIVKDASGAEYVIKMGDANVR